MLNGIKADVNNNNDNQRPTDSDSFYLIMLYNMPKTGFNTEPKRTNQQRWRKKRDSSSHQCYETDFLWFYGNRLDI